MDGAGATLTAEVRGADRGRREQQVGKRVDFDSKNFLRPRLRRVMGAQPGFDMAKRQSERDRCPRPAERARRIALDQHQIGPARSPRPGQRLRHALDMLEGVGQPRFPQWCRADGAKTMFGKNQAGVLASEHDDGPRTGTVEGMNHWSKLDRFGTSPDDDGNVWLEQPSP